LGWAWQLRAESQRRAYEPELALLGTYENECLRAGLDELLASSAGLSPTAKPQVLPWYRAAAPATLKIAVMAEDAPRIHALSCVLFYHALRLAKANPNPKPKPNPNPNPEPKRIQLSASLSALLKPEANPNPSPNPSLSPILSLAEQLCVVDDPKLSEWLRDCGVPESAFEPNPKPNPNPNPNPKPEELYALAAALDTHLRAAPRVRVRVGVEARVGGDAWWDDE